MHNKRLAMWVAGALALASTGVLGQKAPPPSTVPQQGISDIGSFEQVPYSLEPQVALRAEDRMALRKLEDKHIGELRAFEDRLAKDLRTLRAKQQAERQSLLKSFERR
jgi:hypothetical protein